MFALLRKRFERWIAARHPLQSRSVTFVRERLYILPSGYGYFFGLTLLVLFLWSVNYNNNMGFGLTFLLAAIALNCMWRSHNNLLRLSLQALDATPVFAGQSARFTYQLSNPDALPRLDVAVQWQDGSPSHVDVDARGSCQVELTADATRRGWLRPGRLRVSTTFPLGLFRAWTWQEFDQACLVYPKPAGNPDLPHAADPRAVGAHAQSNSAGSDDYAGLRGYVPGDSPRHVAWKSSARAGALMVKRFSGQSAPDLWLDEQTLRHLSIEARLSQLCLWVLAADEAGYSYGLRLGKEEVSPSRGLEHRSRCLRALAEFENDGK